MSQVTNILEGNRNNSTSLVFFDSTIVDSIFGAGLIKYICENITDASELVEVVDIANFDRENINKDSYINVSFVGCLPSDDDIKFVASVFGKDTLFVLCDKIQYDKVKNLAKSISIEYSENDSCSLNLYKIAFGEFEDIIPDVFKYLSNSVLREFDKDYFKGIKFEAGFLKSYSTFDEFYTTLESVLDPEEGQSNPFSSLITSGATVLNNDINYLTRNLSIIKNDTITFGNKKAIYIFSNGKVSENIVDSIGSVSKFIFVFSKYDATHWNIELFKYTSTEDIQLIDEKSLRIEEINTLLISEENTETIDSLNEEKSNLEAELKNLKSVDCGSFCKGKFKGFGTDKHGYGLISNDTFAKILTTKKI